MLIINFSKFIQKYKLKKNKAVVVNEIIRFYKDNIAVIQTIEQSIL
jgi:hypothetical protein